MEMKGILTQEIFCEHIKRYMISKEQFRVESNPKRQSSLTVCL